MIDIFLFIHLFIPFHPTSRSRDGGGLDRMSTSEFLCLSRTVEELVAATEAMCGRQSTALRMGLHGQVSPHLRLGSMEQENGGSL